MTKKKNLPLLEGVQVSAVAAEGRAIVRYDDMVVFTQYVIPGDIVDIQVTRRRHNYMEGRVVRIVQPSPDRLPAPCPHYGVCGGCKWQILPYPLQLQAKQQQVVDAFTRLAKIELPPINPILGSMNSYAYRNKLEFTFSARRWLTPDEIASGVHIDDPQALGFHIPGAFDKVLHIDTCLLMDDINNQVRNAIHSYAIEHGLPYFDLRNNEGFLRTMILRVATTGQVMLIIVFYYDDTTLRTPLLSYIAERFPQITSLLYVINSKPNDTITDQQVHVFKGSDHIYEQMGDLRFKIGPKSFYQTNSLQAYELYKVVRQFAALTGEETVYDLYTGTGTIANFVARKARKVVGIEYVPEAIEDAKVNAQLNGLDNTLFFAGDMKDVLNQEFIKTHGAPDVIITDPPRAGMHESVVETILAAEPKRIVYVSCNPATQARDLALLDAKYKVTAVQPVDMFPHTQHVENVVRLDLRQ